MSSTWKYHTRNMAGRYQNSLGFCCSSFALWDQHRHRRKAEMIPHKTPTCIAHHRVPLSTPNWCWVRQSTAGLWQSGHFSRTDGDSQMGWNATHDIIQGNAPLQAFSFLDSNVQSHAFSLHSWDACTWQLNYAGMKHSFSRVPWPTLGMMSTKGTTIPFPPLGSHKVEEVLEKQSVLWCVVRLSQSLVSDNYLLKGIKLHMQHHGPILAWEANTGAGGQGKIMGSMHRTLGSLRSWAPYLCVNNFLLCIDDSLHLCMILLQLLFNCHEPDEQREVQIRTVKGYSR